VNEALRRTIYQSVRRSGEKGFPREENNKQMSKGGTSAAHLLIIRGEINICKQNKLL
jgi:hypothetical protein